MLRPFLIAALCFSAAILVALPARAEVFLAQDEALALAFPGADEIRRRTLVLTEEQRQVAERRAKTPIESKLFTFFEGWKGGVVLGYAAIGGHVIRTQQETFMVVLTPDGVITKTVILAFHEPLEHLASSRWLGQFSGKSDPHELVVGGAIAGIAGSTLTAQATSAGVRMVLALFDVLKAQEVAH